MALGNKLTKGSVVVRGLVEEHHKTNLFATHVYICDRKIAVGLYCSVLFFIRVFLRGFFLSVWHVSSNSFFFLRLTYVGRLGLLGPAGYQVWACYQVFLTHLLECFAFFHPTCKLLHVLGGADRRCC